jgi:hypothetical protein
MKQASEETRWVVVGLLAAAAIVANTLINTDFGCILLTILLAICGALALRYESRGLAS